ncbi:putative ABC transporter, ATP-binding protein [Alteracholeplasma palmae J233]|uniref:Putative ABC transporter, ATP-binding protein n=1 Tax=Alteracholeplasma palmae (strain ATCC 49389 / J233) TaxID=1318466 RepID=U4KKV5_ALTPJ|nr:ABC transporter ATP-binding protein [Alteracholeplasma palmae]CCV64429.1 putative ABC transporter, ATP-binding protein [Alteracholeplasma palmae J233]
MLEMKNITKSFGPLVANNHVDFTAKKGEIHALLGENGAGKSTLMSILFGLYQADLGDIFINGQKVNIKTPNDATKYKIGMVHQHFKLVDIFTVLENIILGSEDSKNGFLKTKKARKKVEDIMEKYHMELNLDAKIQDLTVGQQQKVEIIKMLYKDSDILVFDEPTAVLTPQEIDEFLSIIKGFSNEGKVVILITHKLNEIKKAAQQCTILRRGKKIATVDVETTSTDKMAELMVGRPIQKNYDKNDYEKSETVLQIDKLTLEGKHKKILDQISFSVSRGEIVGIAGIDGNGQTELVRCLTGLTRITSGKIELNSIDITNLNVRRKNEHGISHIPEDRHKFGLVLDFSLAENLVLERYYQKDFQKYGLIDYKKVNQYAETLSEKYDIRSAYGISTKVRSMSGGNQQKAIIAREIEKDHDLLIAFQPTRGLDVGAIEMIHNELLEQRKNKKGVLLISYELDEIINLSDRILVIYEGRIVGNFDAKKVTPEILGCYMSGGGVKNE